MTLLEPPAPKRTAARLYEIRLPAGQIGSINVGWTPNGASIRPTVPEGYDGLRFIGAGIDRTVARCDAWDGNTIAVGQAKVRVVFEDATIYAGARSALSIGTPTRTLIPEFHATVRGCRIVAPPPTASGGRTPWLGFSYQAGLLLEGNTFEGLEASEHDWYAHGTTPEGMVVQDNRFESAGAQSFKVRSDATETVWAGKNVWIVLRRNVFKNAGQTHTNRGCGFVVIEGGACSILGERNTFWGGGDVPLYPAHVRARAFSISSEGNSYDCDTGRIGVGHGNGFVILRENAMQGVGTAPTWSGILVFVGQNGGTQHAAKAVRLERLSAWGDGYQVQLSAIPKNKTTIVGCNTLALRAYAASIGMMPAHEATIALPDRQMPISEGLVR